MRLLEPPVENNDLNFEFGGGGGVWIVLFSEVTLFEDDGATILLRIVVLYF